MGKTEFIQKEIWMLTYNASFQRAKIYKENAGEEEKKNLRTKLRFEIENEILSDYNNDVSDEKHLENINKIKRSSENFSEILNNGSFSFGVAQKMLNLYLKYQWCLGRIKSIPPHFPVDRQIQEALKIPNIISWTTEMNENDYMNVINIARNRLKEYNKKNIAELELYLFERRNLIISE